ncbi:FecR family protein [Pseudomonas sp. SbB1]|uniref:Anti-FecI sigma factor, FecR n=1 Tax=Pseudomonas putida (strain GB-1) TaxID=76869 RepID=B0KNC8_PSEPG|nr:MULTISPECIES: FecR family protein [Pseudomonas]ABY96668.1 anti-FecI sigma factor, FecR [Pseudomonas putida GB-1]MBP0706414.1 FecR family protein [Pseudomonas sp. T34]MCK2185851.1 FecR family protein [Pseudomonas sp. MB04B]MDD2084971.1 FecR family protein [Pseudomonas putida]MDD2094944.1 FecR family protein [Pseudomonas putida]
MNRRVLNPAAEQAVAWMVRLRSGRDDARQQALFQQWLGDDPANVHAWEQLQRGLGEHFEVVRRAPGALRDTLLQPEVGRRDVLRAMAGLSVLGGSLWFAASSDTGQALTADLRTGTGERRSLTLADGSRLALNADSAVDLAFSGSHRLVRLRRGGLVVQVAADPSRPFIVRSAQGDVRALGTRFLVEQLADATRVVVLEHAVRASLPNGTELDLAEGQAALLHAQRIEPLAAGQAYRADWVQGHLSVLDEPLALVIDALRPYRPGFVRVSPQVRNLRVQGVFPLDDSERTLAALEETMPISVKRYGAWLTLIEAR